MIDPVEEIRLKRRIDRANRVIFVSLFGIILIIVAMLSLILVQNESNLQRARDIAAQNHRRTQAYIKCVAETLLVPVEKRRPEDLKDCTDRADAMTVDAEEQGK